MHGYEVNIELERRQARDWIALSRPQIYYSLEKLSRAGLVISRENSEPAVGPERRVLRTSAKGGRRLEESLAEKEWTTNRDRPPFVTWLILSSQLPRSIVRRQVRRRIRFLEVELAREQEAISAIRSRTVQSNLERTWMSRLVIAQFKLELRWLERVNGRLS